MLIGSKSAIKKKPGRDVPAFFVFGMFVSGREAEDRSKMHQLFLGEKLFFGFAGVGVVHAAIDVNEISKGALATGPTAYLKKICPPTDFP
jgi:hypothetical protein